MRNRVALFLAALVLTSGCSALGLTPEAAATAYQPAPPATPTRNPASEAIVVLDTQGGVEWDGIPKMVLAEQMSYAEANAKLGLMPEYGRWPEETAVWAVVFAGRYRLVPPDLSLADVLGPYEGCVYVLYTAIDRSMISMGDRDCSVPP